MSVEAFNLTTTAKVKSFLDITAATYDTILDTLCNSLTSWIENYCGGRRFKSTEYTQELYDGDDFKRSLKINNYPIIAWTKIEFNAGTTANPDWTEYEASDYEKYDTSGMIWFDRLEKGKRNIRITYEAGYETIPYDLELLATKLVARTFEKRLSEQKVSEGSPDLNITWDEFIKKEDKIVLENYTRVVI